MRGDGDGGTVSHRMSEKASQVRWYVSRDLTDMKGVSHADIRRKSYPGREDSCKHQGIRHIQRTFYVIEKTGFSFQ